MPVYSDLVQETSATGGTGNQTLLGASLGYNSFNAAFSTNVPFDYVMRAVDGNGNPTGQWEVGTGHLSDSTTFVRDVVWASSTGATGQGGQVNFGAGTINIYSNWAAYAASGAANMSAFDLQFGTL